LKTASEILRKKKADMIKSQNSRKSTALVRSQLENILKHYDIDRAAYHGGDLTGTHVERFLQNAEDIITEFKVIIMAAEDKVCNENEINDVHKRYVELCTLLDYLFSLARTPCGDGTEEIYIKTDDVIKKVCLPYVYVYYFFFVLTYFTYNMFFF
jgi:hypothetical protein